ncbi:MAG TPA: glycosyltransferase [Phycisphaerae bacterium]|nr:glycosyltransferase [Phycisphaerae bacterium]
MAMTISVVIPTHNRPDCLRRIVECLLCQTYPPTELFLVNDGNIRVDPALMRMAESAGIRSRVICRGEPSSAASRNAGLSAATGDIVVCIDDDMILPPNLLSELVDLYERDAHGVVAGIGILCEQIPRTWKWRLWEVVSTATGRVRWAPRRAASRYVRVGAALAGRLRPARMMSGGAMSLRGRIARWARFDESMKGYSFGEDREFSYRIGREHALFVAPSLRVEHAPAAGGRGDWRKRGGVYVENILYIVRRSVDGGAGTVLLVALDFAATMVQYSLWAVLTWRRENLDFAIGMAEALLRRGAGAVRKILCGC